MFGYRKSYYATHPHVFIRELYQQIKWFIQRGWRGYAECDIWSIDYYLCGWLPKALRELAENVHGVPFDLAEVHKDGSHDVTDKHLNNWKAEIRIMADGFEARLNISDCKYKHDSKEEKEAQRKSEIGIKLFVKRFDNLWD